VIGTGLGARTGIGRWTASKNLDTGQVPLAGGSDDFFAVAFLEGGLLSERTNESEWTRANAARIVGFVAQAPQGCLSWFGGLGIVRVRLVAAIKNAGQVIKYLFRERFFTEYRNIVVITVGGVTARGKQHWDDTPPWCHGRRCGGGSDGHHVRKFGRGILNLVPPHDNALFICFFCTLFGKLPHDRRRKGPLLRGCQRTPRRVLGFLGGTFGRITVVGAINSSFGTSLGFLLLLGAAVR